MTSLQTVVCMGLVLAAAGCESSPQGTWVARVQGADAWLGVKVEGEDASAFVCGGVDNLATHTRWMYGEPDGDEVTFEQDGVRLDAHLEVSSVTGNLTVQGQLFPIDMHLSVAKDLEGVYTGLDAGCRAGLIIVAPNEEGQSTARGAWCDDLGHMAQVTPVQPIELTEQGIAVEADTAIGFRNFFVEPVVPAELAP